jgi:hypothetical protein
VDLVFDDADFFDCKPTNEMCIEALLADIPDEFRDLATYGYWLSGWDTTLRQQHDDPVEGMVERPPCRRHRQRPRFVSIALHWQSVPRLVVAPERILCLMSLLQKL